MTARTPIAKASQSRRRHRAAHQDHCDREQHGRQFVLHFDPPYRHVLHQFDGGDVEGPRRNLARTGSPLVHTAIPAGTSVRLTGCWRESRRWSTVRAAGTRRRSSCRFSADGTAAGHIDPRRRLAPRRRRAGSRRHRSASLVGQSPAATRAPVGLALAPKRRRTPPRRCRSWTVDRRRPSPERHPHGGPRGYSPNPNQRRAHERVTPHGAGSCGAPSLDAVHDTSPRCHRSTGTATPRRRSSSRAGL